MEGPGAVLFFAGVLVCRAGETDWSGRSGRREDEAWAGAFPREVDETTLFVTALCRDFPAAMEGLPEGLAAEAAEVEDDDVWDEALLLFCMSVEAGTR